MSDKSTIINLILASLLTLFLFYIDEGYYNFKWMLNPGNWSVFGFYGVVLFGVFSLVTFGYNSIRKFVVGKK
jgi:hypothetical protein